MSVKNKVVINNCYGRFGLSDKAIDLYRTLSKNPYWEEGDTYRHDPILIKVVESLRHGADGDFSYLLIKEIKGNIYRIKEYNGLESIETPDTVEWIVI